MRLHPALMGRILRVTFIANPSFFVVAKVISFFSRALDSRAVNMYSCLFLFFFPRSRFASLHILPFLFDKL